MSLLEIQNLSVRFEAKSGLFGSKKAGITAVDDVSFTIQEGETVGLVGESGSGKTTLGRAIVRLLEPSSGRIIFNGKDITHLRGVELRACRRNFQIVFQDPYSSLDPRLTVEETIAEALEIHRLAERGTARRKRIGELLQFVGLDPTYANRYPHEFSGGQRQRIGIARALAVEPRLLVCDEPVSALDVSVQAQIVNLLKDLQQQRGISLLFIAHDLAVVGHVSHRVLVMYLGRIVEQAPARSILSAPKHPYTQALISAVPVIDPETRRARIVWPGETPSPLHPPTGCPFHPRCPRTQVADCQAVRPALRLLAHGHDAACHLAE